MINGLKKSDIFRQDQISTIISRVNGYDRRKALNRPQDSSSDSFNRERSVRNQPEPIQKIEIASNPIISPGPIDIWGEPEQSLIIDSPPVPIEEVKRSFGLGSPKEDINLEVDIKRYGVKAISPDENGYRSEKATYIVSEAKVESGEERMQASEKKLIIERLEEVIKDCEKNGKSAILEAYQKFAPPSWERPEKNTPVIRSAESAIVEENKNKDNPVVLEGPKQLSPSCELQEKPSLKEPIAESLRVFEEPKSESVVKLTEILISITPALQQKLVYFSRKITDTVDEKTPSELRYRDFQLYIEKFKKLLQSKFSASKISVVGSISYCLFLESSAIDIQILNPDLPDKQVFQSLLQDFLSPQGACSSHQYYLQFKGEWVFHIYCNTSLPLHTSMLLSKYNSTPEINTFLYYVKLWAGELHVGVTGYFWTLTALFYLWYTEPHVLENLQQGEIHVPLPVEGFDLWVDSRELMICRKSSWEMYGGFLRFLQGGSGCVFIGKTGEVVQDEEYAMGVSDIFTDVVIGIPVKYREVLQKKINQSCEEILEII